MCLNLQVCGCEQRSCGFLIHPPGACEKPSDCVSCKQHRFQKKGDETNLIVALKLSAFLTNEEKHERREGEKEVTRGNCIDRFPMRSRFLRTD